MTVELKRRKERRALAAKWTLDNEILNEGEIGWEKDTNLFKFGDGVSRWNDRPWAFNPFGMTYTVTNDGPPFTATVNPPLTAYVEGQSFLIAFTSDGVGDDTLNLNGLGAIPLTKNGTDPIAAGDIKVGQVLLVAFDGTNFQIVTKAGSAGGGGDVSSLNWIFPEDYGAIGDGMINDTAAVQAALIAANSSGSGRVFFRAPQYNITDADLIDGIYGALTMEGSQGFQWWGPDVAVAPRTTIHIIATDSRDGLKCFQIQGLEIRHLQFDYAAGYSGILLNVGGDGGVGTNTFDIHHCTFRGNANGTRASAKAFIGLQDVVCGDIRYCNFQGAQSLIRGWDVAMDGTPGGFSNDVTVSNCNFERCTVGQIVNPGINWRIRDCTFEFTTSNGGPAAPYGITCDTRVGISFGYLPKVLVDSCTFWDASTSGQIPIYFPAGQAYDLKISNCWFHTFNNKHIKVLCPGNLFVEDNSFSSNVPVNTVTLIDCGDPTTAHKTMLKITGNYWVDFDSGSQELAIINYAGHGKIGSFHNGSVVIANNSQTGIWDNGPNAAAVTGLTELTFNASNSGKKFHGCTGTLDGSTLWQSWEFSAIAANTVTSTINFPAATGSADIRVMINGVAAATGKNSISLTDGTMRIVLISTVPYAGVLYGEYNIETHGPYTLNT